MCKKLYNWISDYVIFEITDKIYMNIYVRKYRKHTLEELKIMYKLLDITTCIKQHKELCKIGSIEQIINDIYKIDYLDQEWIWKV